MNINKSHIPLIVTTLFGIILLALQKPVTDSLVKKSDKLDARYSKIYNIKSTHFLPEILNEISGFTWLSENVFACIQDEDGFIYIYDVAKKDMVSTIKFGTSGDYEGLAINNKDAYVMRSDGTIYGVEDFRSDSLHVTKYKTLFSGDHNIESLTYDKDNDRLLIAPKDEGLYNNNEKSIYQIPLQTLVMDSLPTIKIDLNAAIFKPYKHKKIHKTFNPSDIAIHPITKEIYVLEGKDPKLLILNSEGKLLHLHPLDERKFGQPEGITFSPEGRLFISNEATKSGSASILEVELK